MTDPVRLARGCWVSAPEAASLHARCLALVELAPADTVVTGYTAAQLHGLWLPDRDQRPQLATRTPGRPPRGMTRPRRTELATSRRLIADEHMTSLAGVPVTTLARTWVDLAACLGLPDLVAAGDSALRLGASVTEMADLVRALPRRRGIRLAAQALPMLDERARSRPESHLRVAVQAPGMPQFQVNEAICNDVGEWLAEPDLACPEARIALEYQGERHADLARMRKDVTRLGDLRRAGWLTFLYGPAEVFKRPWQIAPELRAVLSRRAPHLLGPVPRSRRRVGS